MKFTTVTDQEYHRGQYRSWVGSSHLKVANVDLSRYYNQFIAPPDDDEKPSDALVLGSLVHCLALEGEMPAHLRFSVIPASLSPYTKVGKAQKAGILADAYGKGKDVVKEKDWEQAAGMVASLKANESFLEQKENANSIEGAYFWEEDGVRQKIKPDLVNEVARTFSDIKTTSFPRDFHNQAFKYGYHLSIAHYEAGLVHGYGGVPYRTGEAIEGTMVWDHILFVVDKEPPYTVWERDFSRNALDLGREERLEALARLRTAFETNEWGEPRAAPRSLGVPDWYGQGRDSPECFAF